MFNGLDNPLIYNVPASFILFLLPSEFSLKEHSVSPAMLHAAKYRLEEISQWLLAPSLA
jgi:hypothetical protein